MRLEVERRLQFGARPRSFRIASQAVRSPSTNRLLLTPDEALAQPAGLTAFQPLESGVGHLCSTLCAGVGEMLRVSGNWKSILCGMHLKEDSRRGHHIFGDAPTSRNWTWRETWVCCPNDACLNKLGTESQSQRSSRETQACFGVAAFASCTTVQGHEPSSQIHKRLQWHLGLPGALIMLFAHFTSFHSETLN